MYLVGLGLILTLMKYFDYGPVAEWSWLIVLAPFAAAMAWWSFADYSGLTAKQAMQRELKRKDDRIQRSRISLGTTSKQRERK